MSFCPIFIFRSFYLCILIYLDDYIDDRVTEPHAEVVAAIMNHDLSPVGFDLASTQHLVSLCMCMCMCMRMCMC